MGWGDVGGAGRVRQGHPHAVADSSNAKEVRMEPVALATLTTAITFLGTEIGKGMATVVGINTNTMTNTNAF